MSDSRRILLGSIGEEEFSQHVKRVARRFGWHGGHVRYSQGVVEGIHTTRLDGHSDAHGMLDWELVNERPGLPVLRLELKAETGRVRAEQRAWQRWYERSCGVVADFLRPSQEDKLQRLLAGPRPCSCQCHEVEVA